jgi:hypothetical protein
VGCRLSGMGRRLSGFEKWFLGEFLARISRISRRVFSVRHLVWDRGQRSEGREGYAVAMTALMAVFISSNTVGDTAPVFLKKRFVDTDLI